jgi:PAS domain S-box-containing protein
MRRLAIDFEALFESMPTPFMVLDKDLRFVAMNTAYLAMTARSKEQLAGVFVFDAFPESGERQEATRRPFQLALAGQENIVKRNVFAIERPGIGRQDVYWDVHHTPVRDIDGAVVGVLQYALDVSAEIEAERMRDVISQEYDHRVRNMMAKISAIARQTARYNAETSEFLSEFERRIGAMARTHELLINGGWEQLGLRALVDSELEAYADKGQTLVSGENVALSSRVGQALGMALHELAINAAKYGALSQATGRLSVHWEPDKDHGVTLHWHETGVAMTVSESPSGFGTTIIDRVLPLETDGSVTREIASTGLTCTIVIPDPLKG